MHDKRNDADGGTANSSAAAAATEVTLDLPLRWPISELSALSGTGVDRWIEAGWTDAFRKLHPDEAGHYTWWRQWGGAREKNVGWRIDYVFASPAAMKRTRDAFIWPDALGSDHCPVGVDIDSP